MDKLIIGVFVVILLVLVFALCPLCLLWGLNILLPMVGLGVIPITLKSWFGAFLIVVALKGGSSSTSKKS